jgi:predicted HTH transcriptional regulator
LTPLCSLIAAVVSLANTEGGDFLLGVEDDGTVSGLHSMHQNISSLPALIAIGEFDGPGGDRRLERAELRPEINVCRRRAHNTETATLRDFVKELWP